MDQLIALKVLMLLLFVPCTIVVLHSMSRISWIVGLIAQGRYVDKQTADELVFNCVGFLICGWQMALTIGYFAEYWRHAV